MFCIVILPDQIAVIRPSSKATSLGECLMYSSLVMVVFSPIWGVLSDRTINLSFCGISLGKRHPYLLLSLVGSAAILWKLKDPISDFHLYCAIFASAQVFMTMGGSAFNGLMADEVCEDERGQGSGILGTAIAVGNLCGAGIGVFYTSIPTGMTIFIVYIFFGLGVILTVVIIRPPAEADHQQQGSESSEPFLPKQQGNEYAIDLEDLEDDSFGVDDFGLKEKEKGGASDKGRDTVTAEEPTLFSSMTQVIEPFKSLDFTLVFATRFLTQMGVQTVQSYAQYYLGDVTPLPDGIAPATAVVSAL